MNCASCGRTNPAGSRFCAGCGTALAPRCAACGAESPADARFCVACGAPLAGAAAPETVSRKIVTIVFADLIGSVSLHERLDAESARRADGPLPPRDVGGGGRPRRPRRAAARRRRAGGLRRAARRRGRRDPRGARRASACSVRFASSRASRAPPWRASACASPSTPARSSWATTRTASSAIRPTSRRGSSRRRATAT